MSIVQVSLFTSQTPDQVLRILTDFGPSRAGAWAGVDDDHLLVHDEGPGWADVTEGNKVGWERERYSWDAAAGTVTAVTTESNLWGPGSRWDYQITPREGGSQVDVTVHRNGKGVKGKLIGALLPLIGKGMIKSSISGALEKG
jgi:hypothetical protein